MKPEIKQKWIEALRSGEYSQTEGKLHTPDGFCCLGVLTDLYLKETNQQWEFHEKTGDITSDDYYTFEETDDFLPKSVSDWAGLNTNCPEVMTENGDFDEESDGDEYLSRELSDLNDNGYNFESIAELIQAQL